MVGRGIKVSGLLFRNVGGPFKRARHRRFVTLKKMPLDSKKQKQKQTINERVKSDGFFYRYPKTYKQMSKFKTAILIP